MKKKIVIASVLKPVDDVRAYWKLSQSISKTNKYEVNIIGNVGKKPSEEDNIRFHAHALNRRNWVKRILIREQILFKILRLNPDLLVINTHELLNTAFLCKLFLRCKVVYDVQENYRLNLLTINPSWFKKVIANLAALKEGLSKYFIDQYWLAERCYSDELHFVNGKELLLENKAFEHAPTSKDLSEPHLLFSGTISEYGGVRKAVLTYITILEKNPKATLTVIGQIHDKKLNEWLKQQGEKYAGLKLKTSANPIPYKDILEAIVQSNLGVIGYQPNLSNRNKIPTKLYEYSRYQLPYLVEKETKWSKLGSKLGGAIPVDFSTIDIDHVIDQWQNQLNLFPNVYPEEASWEYESVKMISSLNDLINKH